MTLSWIVQRHFHTFDLYPSACINVCFTRIFALLISVNLDDLKKKMFNLKLAMAFVSLQKIKKEE